MRKLFRKYFPGITSKYARRLLEPIYDRLSRTELGRYFKNMSTSEKCVTEASMYVATEFLESKLEGRTGLGRVVREVVGDAAPEIAKRMINRSDPEGQDSPSTSGDVGRKSQHEVVVGMTDDLKSLRRKLRQNRGG